MSEESLEVEFDQEMVKEFLEESIDEISKMENLLLQFEQKPEDREPIDGVFRIAHSIKGSAAFFKLFEIQKLAHSLENVLDLLRKGEVPPSQLVISALLPGFLELEGMCDRASQGLPEIENEDFLNALYNQLNNLTQQKRDLRDEVILYLNTVQAFMEQVPPEVAQSPAFNVLKKESERLALTAEASHKKSEFRKTGDFFYQGKDVSGEMSAVGDIIKTPLDTSFPVNTAQRLLDALSSLCSILKEEDLLVGRQMLTMVEMVLAEIRPFDDEVQHDLRDGYEHLLTSMAQTPAGQIPKAAKKETGLEKPLEKREGKTMRVSEEKVDGFMHFVGELVVVSDMLNYIDSEMDKVNISQDLSNRFKQARQSFNTLSQKLRESLLEVRRVSVDGLLRKVPGLARNVADKLGKHVKVETIGNEIQIDKSLYELLDHPLTHLVRNAVDHGLEATNVRQQKGKPSEGLLRVIVQQTDDWVTLTIEDDGGGINIEHVKKKALERGLISSETAQKMQEEEALHLITLAGFSTAEAVSDISGRGVGLDVVKENIEGVNGKLKIESEFGKGTKFQIRLPSTTGFVVVDGVNTLVGQNEFIFPVENMQLAFRPRQEDFFVAEQKEMVRHGEEIIRMLRMHQVFHINPTYQDPTEAILVVVENQQHRFAVMVDKLLGGTQVVIRELGIKELGQTAHQGIAGGAIMGHGDVALVLDVKSLAEYL